MGFKIFDEKQEFITESAAYMAGVCRSVENFPANLLQTHADVTVLFAA